MKRTSAAKSVREKEFRFASPIHEVGNLPLVDTPGEMSHWFAVYCSHYPDVDYHRIYAFLTTCTFYDAQFACGSFSFDERMSESSALHLIGNYYIKQYRNIDNSDIFSDENLYNYLKDLTVAQACDGLQENPFENWWTKYFPIAAAANNIDIDTYTSKWLSKHHPKCTSVWSPLKIAFVDTLDELERNRYCDYNPNIDRETILEYWRDLTETALGWAILRKIGAPYLTEDEFVKGVDSVMYWESRRRDCGRLKMPHLRRDRINAWLMICTKQELDDIHYGAAYGFLSMRHYWPFDDNYDAYGPSSESLSRHRRKIYGLLSDYNRKFILSDDMTSFIECDNKEIMNSSLPHSRKTMLTDRNDRIKYHSIVGCGIKAIPSHTKIKMPDGTKQIVETGHNGYVNLRVLIGDDQRLHAYWDATHCDNALLCAMCARKKMVQRQHEIVEGLTYYKEEHPDAQFMFLTFTFPHKDDKSLTIVIEKLMKAQNALRSGRWYHDFRDQYNMTGCIKCLEATYSMNNWWHPHYHYVFIFERTKPFTKKEALLLRAEFSRRWIDQCIKFGLVENTKENKTNMMLHAVDIEYSCKDIRHWKYLAKLDPLNAACDPTYVSIDNLSFELTNPGQAKVSKLNGHISSWDVLRRATDMNLKIDDESREIYKKAWAQYVLAMNHRSPIRWSKGLKAECNIKEKEKREGNLFTTFDDNNVQKLHDNHLHISALVNVENHMGFSNNFKRLLEKRGIKYFDNAIDYDIYMRALKKDALCGTESVNDVKSSTNADAFIFTKIGETKTDVLSEKVIETVISSKINKEKDEEYRDEALEIRQRFEFIKECITYFDNTKFSSVEFVDSLRSLVDRYNSYKNEPDWHVYINGFAYTDSDTVYENLEDEIEVAYMQCRRRLDSDSYDIEDLRRINRKFANKTISRYAINDIKMRRRVLEHHQLQLEIAV